MAGTARVEIRKHHHLKDDTPPGQLPPHVARYRYPEKGGVSIHSVRVWTQVPHPRYGDRQPHFLASLVPCLSDHRITRDCYYRSGGRQRRV